MKTSKLIKLLDIIIILRKCIGLAKVEIKYVDSEYSIPLEITDKIIEEIIDDASVESIRLIIKI